MWGRVVSIEVTGPNGVILATDELYVDITYMHEWGMADVCTVQVYNLAPATFKSLTTNDALTIKLTTGYRDAGDKSLLLEGHVNNVWGQTAVPNHITHLYCVPSALYDAAGNTSVPISSERSTTLEQYLSLIATAMNMGPPDFTGVASLKKSELVGKRSIDTPIYTELVKLNKQHNIRIRIIDKKMTVHIDPTAEGVLQKSVDSGVTPIVLSTALLKGTPKLSTSVVAIPYILSPHLRSGDIIDLGVASDPQSLASTAEVSGIGSNLNRSNALIESVTSQLYMIEKVEHKASAFSKSWHSMITGLTHKPNLKGQM